MNHTEYMRIWRENNRARYREITNKSVNKFRRVKRDAALAISKRANNKKNFGGLRDIVLIRDQYTCVICFTDMNLTVDHIDRNRSNNVLENLQTLCRSCHGRKDGQARKIKSGWTFKRKSK